MTPFAHPRLGLLARAVVLLAILLIGPAGRTDEPMYKAEFVFAPEHWHNHASCVVELPGGELLVCWYHGSGERTADNVIVEGARLPRGSTQWSERFVLADTPGYPDANPCMVVDPEARLWLFWPAILDNHWESALLKYRVSTNYSQAGSPIWSTSEVLHVTPKADFQPAVFEFATKVESQLSELSQEQQDSMSTYLKELRGLAQNKLSQRLGWMPRPHPVVLNGRRLLLPLYSDGFNFALMVFTDDWGATWQTGSPLPGPGNVQPSVVQRRDGSLYTLMRDNGPAPKRLLQSSSTDGGVTWSPVTDSELLNSGTGLEIIGLRNGNWVLINNDTERGRHRLVVQMSDDEGRTWKWRRYLEEDPPGPQAGSYSYPSLIEAADGTLHATYSYHLNRPDLPLDSQGLPARKCIKHAHFNLAWIQSTPDRVRP